MIGPTWGLIDKMACFVNLEKRKNKITVICEIDQMASCYLTGVYLLKAVRPPDFRASSYMTIPSGEFFIGGV